MATVRRGEIIRNASALVCALLCFVPTHTNASCPEVPQNERLGWFRYGVQSAQIVCTATVLSGSPLSERITVHIDDYLAGDAVPSDTLSFHKRGRVEYSRFLPATHALLFLVPCPDVGWIEQLSCLSTVIDADSTMDCQQVHSYWPALRDTLVGLAAETTLPGLKAQAALAVHGRVSGLALQDPHSGRTHGTVSLRVVHSYLTSAPPDSGATIQIVLPPKATGWTHLDTPDLQEGQDYLFFLTHAEDGSLRMVGGLFGAWRLASGEARVETRQPCWSPGMKTIVRTRVTQAALMSGLE